MTPFHCGQCGQTVFFDNHQCGACGTALGYAPVERRIVALANPPDAEHPEAAVPEAGHWRAWRCCANRHGPAGCNWLIEVGDAPPVESPDPVQPPAPAPTPALALSGAPASLATALTPQLCMSCRLTAVIPDLSVPGNPERWFQIEQAKRRLIYTLIGMGLAPDPKRDDDDLLGLAFHLKGTTEDGEPVMTGHANGVITLNIAEADDDQREAVRVAMNEPVRTLLGHLRHEVSHYLQYRWLTDPMAAEACRAQFGDERADYSEALSAYHTNGAPADWAEHYISAYASAHPWEDWAETCAHVLLIVDAVETAARWGLRLDGPAASAQPPVHALHTAHWPEMDELVLEHWLPVARFVNAMNRSLGMPDSYPFLMPDPVLQKMRAVQQLLRSAVTAAAAAQPSA